MGGSLCWIAHRDPTHPQAGGAERSIAETAKGLAARGWRFHLIAGGYVGASHTEQVGAMHVVRGSGPVAMHWQLSALMAQCGPVDVVVEDLGHVVPYLSGAGREVPGIAFFRHLHGRTLPLQVGGVAAPILSAVERGYPLFYRRWPFVAPSAGAARDLAQLGISQERIHRIPYGVNSDTFCPGPLTERPSLVFFSGLRPYKRPDHAVRLLRLLMDSGMGATLEVVGNGPELGSLRALSGKLGVEGQVHFLGLLAEPELAALIRRSWLHVQCSVAEGWGLTSSEAAASGVPTVAYRVPGIVESVVPGVTGLLVDSGNLPALAMAASSILRSRAEWTNRARAAMREYTWDTAAKQWDHLLLGQIRSGVEACPGG